MAPAKKRSRDTRPAAKSSLTRSASTYLTEEVGIMMERRISELRVKEAAYIRRLIELDLGVITEETP